MDFPYLCQYLVNHQLLIKYIDLLLKFKRNSLLSRAASSAGEGHQSPHAGVVASFKPQLEQGMSLNAP